MYSKPRLALKYLHYLLTASNGKGHGVHSPFVYAFVRNVLRDRKDSRWFSRIEKERKKFLTDSRSISVSDLGAGSAGSSAEKWVHELARRSLSTPKFGRFLFRLAGYYHCHRLFEFGTSLGISGSYLLAGAGRGATLLTMEGAEPVAKIAAGTFADLGLTGARVTCGDFERLLPDVLPGLHPDLVFIDGNHRKEPLLKYFNAVLKESPAPAVVVIHDIHWSREMEEGWQTICDLPEVRLTVDLFSAGLVFFSDKFMIRQHFTIRF